MSKPIPETLLLQCHACGNKGSALREPGDRLPYSASGNFFLRYPSISSVAVQIVCGICGRVQPLKETTPGETARPGSAGDPFQSA